MASFYYNPQVAQRECYIVFRVKFKRGYSLSLLKKLLGAEKSPRVVVYGKQMRERRDLGRKLMKKSALQLTNVKFRSIKSQVRPLSRIATVAGLILIGYIVFGSNFFTLDSLEVQGAHLADKEEIIKTIFPDGFTKVNAVTFNEWRARRRMADMHEISEIKFHKNLISNTLTIEVMEHQTSIIWQTGGEKFLVNRFGVIYDIAEEGSPLLTVEDLKNIPVSLNQRIITEEFIDFVTSFTANLPRRTNNSIRRITVPETTFEVEMETNDGWRIILDTTKSWEEQLNNLVRVLREKGDEQPKEYVDLRVGKKVFYK